MRLTEKIFDRFFENSLDIFCILSSDWKFVRLNKIWQKILGHDILKLEGKPLLDFVHPDDIIETIKVKEELEKDVEVRRFTNRIKSINNTNKWLEWSFFLDGEYIYATARDITQTEQVEKVYSQHVNFHGIVLDTITVGLIFAKQSKFEWANRAFLEMFNCNLEDIVGKHLSLFYKNKNEYNKIHREALASFVKRESYYSEIEVENENGSIHWVSFTGKALYPENPEEGTVWMIQDISKQKQNEKEIKQLAELQQTTLDALTVGVSFIKDRKIEWCNKAYDRIFGYEPGEMVNMPTSKIYKSLEGYEQVKSEGYPILEKGGVYNTEIECVTKNGDVIWIKLTGKAIDKEAPFQGSIWMLNDITQEKAQEEKLFKNEKWLEDSQRIGKMGNWEMDLKTNIVFWSQSAYEIFGVNPSEKKLNFEEIIKATHPDDLEMVERQHEENMRTGKINSQFRIIRPNGDIRIIWSVGEIIYNDNNDPVRIIGIVQDITEQKKIELEIKDKDEGLKRSEAILKATMESMDDALLIVDADKRVTHFNTNFARLFDIPKEILETKDDLLFLTHAKKQLKDPDEFHKYVTDIYNTQSIIRDKLIFKNNHVIERLSYPLQETSPIKGRVWLFRDISERIKNEERLSLFKNSIDFSNNEIYWLNEDASFYYVNEQACRSLGYTKEELLKLKVFDIDPVFPKEKWDEQWKWFQEHPNEENERLQFESLHLRKDGKIFPIEVVLNHLRLDGKEFHIAHVRDITERKKNEEHLNMFKISIDDSLDEVYWLNKDARFEYVNNQALKSLGYTYEELIKLNLFDIDPIYTREKWDKLWEIYQTRKNNDGIGTRKETLHRRKDGTIYPAEVMVNHIWLNDKELHISYVRDISERKQNEENLLRNQKMLSETQRIANVGSWELNLISNNVTWSKQSYEIFGLKDKSMPITLDYFFQFVYPDDREHVKQVINEALETKLFKNFECRIIRADNKIITLLGEGEILLDEDGNPTYILGAVQDISERKEAEAEIKKLNAELEVRVTERTSQLHKVNKELEAFAYSVSHDLRAPIRHIDGFLSLMYSNIDEPKEIVKSYYQKISASSKRMSEMIDGLLKFSRLGRASIDFVSVDTSQLINEIIKNLKPDYSQRIIKWDVKTLPVVSGDQTLLRIAFENVISNAIKYTVEREQAEIEIGVCHKQKNSVCIYIKDNGAGFDMKYKEKLFGVFQRLHSNSEFEGIGIGLANAKQIILKHDGKIDAVSKVNKGTIIYITLPILK